MNTPRRPAADAWRVGVVAAVLMTADRPPTCRGEIPPGVIVQVSRDGDRTTGRFEGDVKSGFRFQADGPGPSSPLEPGAEFVGPGKGPGAASGLPPFRLEFGRGERVAGRLGLVGPAVVRLLGPAGERSLEVSRAGVRALVQRPGESQVLQDGFETLDPARWSVVGDPELVTEPRAAGAHSLRIPAGGASLTHRLAEPFASGRLEVAFFDGGQAAAGQQWFADLTFRTGSGPETARAVLGWSEESLAVESPGGPALAVQRLARKPGWHRLGVRFGPEQCSVSADGNELAHGKGFGGPLVEVRLASVSAGDRAAPEGLAGFIDDLRLVRFAEPAGGLETDATQDEVRMTGGDQVFGRVVAADAESVRLAVAGREVALSWGEVAGLYFRRESAPGVAVDGLLVAVQWRAAEGSDPRDLNRVEGALTAVSPAGLNVATAYCGPVAVPLDRLAALSVQGRGLRVVIDPTAHHLGDEVSTRPPVLDPPQPEGGVLERAVTLETVPAGAASLVLDVVQVVGEGRDLEFSPLIRKGELRTNVALNGRPLDYLNRHIASRNETPERVRLPIPQGFLRPGRNVFRFQQVGKAGDPNYLDDLGVLSIALEFTPE